MNQNSQNTNAFLIHISSFAGYLFPLGSIIAPLILWQSQKNKSIFLDKHGKEAVNFNISFALYVFVLGAGLLSLFLGGVFDVFNEISSNLNATSTNNSPNISFIFKSLFGFFGIVSLVSIASLIKIILIIIAAIKANNGEQYEYPLTIKFIK